MSSGPGAGPGGDSVDAGTTATVRNFARTLSAHLPRRLAQLRELGRSTRAIGTGKPPRR